MAKRECLHIRLTHETKKYLVKVAKANNMTSTQVVEFFIDTLIQNKVLWLPNIQITKKQVDNTN